MIELPDVVDEQHARAHEAQRTAVRVAAGDRRRRVHHRDDPGVDQPVGRDPVEVGVVDDGDVTRLEPLGEVLRALAHPGAAHDLPRRRGAAVAASALSPPLRRGRGEELLGVVLAGVAVGQPGEHPGELAHPGLRVRAPRPA